MKSEHPLLSRDCLMICYVSGAPATTPQCRRASLHSAFDPTARCSSNRPEKSGNWHETTGTKAEFERQEPLSASAFCFCAEPALLTRYSLSNTGETSRREAVIAESDP
jgi:hypothetical protein